MTMAVNLWNRSHLSGTAKYQRGRTTGIQYIDATRLIATNNAITGSINSLLSRI